MEAYNALYPQTPWIHSANDVQQSQDVAQAAGQGDSMSSHPTTIDINHPSFGLAEIQQASSSSTSTIAPAALYHTFAPLAQNGHTGYYTPYNVMAYGQTPWTQQHLPLSSYSTLNGATTSNSQPQQRQDSPPMQSMMIDPSLTINTTASSNGSHLYSHNGVDQASQQSHYQTLFAHSPPQPPQTLSINPMFVNALAHQQLQQQHQQQQTTLSPTVLHSPTASTSSSMYYPTSAAPVQTNLTASSSSSGRSSAPVESLSQKRQRLQTRLRGLPNLTGGGAVKAIVGAIDDCEAADVDPSTRLEIITRIRDKSPAHFFRAWCENPDAMDITREWLKDGATRRDNGAFEETIMPLLQVIARLPFTVEQMLTYKMGKIIVKLTKWPNAAIKDMAADIERGWKQLIADVQDGPSKKSEGNNEDKLKKRKMSDSSLKAAPPAKKLATSATATASRPGFAVKKETKVIVTSVVKESKSDSSFFSQSKPKAKLPSFKKAPAPGSASGAGSSVKRESEEGGSSFNVNVAQPSAIDPFQEALKSMQKNRRGSPAQTTFESASTATTTAKSEFVKPGKKKKSVTWAAEGKLEQIKLIDKAIYDDDPMDGSHSSHSIRDLERAEGAAMHTHLFEEAIDWYEPIVLEFPGDIQLLPPRGSNSQERDAQEEREKSSLEVLYVNSNQVPDTPGEPSSQIPLEHVDAEAKTMLAGSEIQPFFQSAMSVSQLVGQLKGPIGAGQGIEQQGVPNAMNMGSFSAPDVQMVMQSLMGNNNVGVPPTDGNAPFDLRQLGLDPTALSSLTSLLGSVPATTNGTTANAFGSSIYPDGGNGTTDGYLGGYGDEYGTGSAGFGDRQRDREESSGRGRRGKGRGAGGLDGYRNKRKAAPCMFYQQGRCKFGDACDFSHDPAHRDGGGGSSGYFD